MTEEPPSQPPPSPEELRVALLRWMRAITRVGSSWPDVPGKHRREMLRIAREIAAMLRRL